MTNGATTSSTAVKEVTIPATAKHPHGTPIPFGQDGADVDSAATIAPEESMPSPSGNGATAPLNGFTNGHVNGGINGVNGHVNGVNGNGTVNDGVNGAVNGSTSAVNGAATNGHNGNNGHSNNGNRAVPNLLDKLRGVIWYGGGNNGNNNNN